MANDHEFVEMVKFVNKNVILPEIDGVFPPDKYLEALQRFEAPDHYGKIVIRF